jgi:hypothetical protein
MGGDSNPGFDGNGFERQVLPLKLSSLIIDVIGVLLLLRTMASIHRHPNSKFWHCCVNIPGHGQLFRSTKQTNRHEALEVARKLESAARGNALTEVQARKILAERGDSLRPCWAKHF